MGKRIVLALVVTVVLSLLLAGSALADDPHSGTTKGQPNQSCGSFTAPDTPGLSALAPGSAFNPEGKAGTAYAGQQPQNSKNPQSVSQYDVACFQVSQPHP